MYICVCLAHSRSGGTLVCVPERVHTFDSHWVHRHTFIHDVTRSYLTWRIHMWHDSVVCVQDLFDSFICDMAHSLGTWLSCMCAGLVWLSCVCAGHGSFICDMAHSYVTWLTHMWHDSFVCVQDLFASLLCVCTTSGQTHVHMWHGSFICDITLLCV